VKASHAAVTTEGVLEAVAVVAVSNNIEFIDNQSTNNWLMEVQLHIFDMSVDGPAVPFPLSG